MSNKNNGNVFSNGRNGKRKLIPVYQRLAAEEKKSNKFSALQVELMMGYGFQSAT